MNWVQNECESFIERKNESKKYEFDFRKNRIDFGDA